MSKKDLKELVVLVAVNLLLCYAIYRILTWTARFI